MSAELQHALDQVGWTSRDDQPRHSRAVWEWMQEATRTIKRLEAEAVELREDLRQLREDTAAAAIEGGTLG